MVVINTVIIRIIAGINSTVSKITVHPIKEIAVLTLVSGINRDDLTGCWKITVCIKSNHFVIVLIGRIIQRKSNGLFCAWGNFCIAAKNFEACSDETFGSDPIPTQIKNINTAICTQIIRIRCTGNYKVSSGLRRWGFCKTVGQVIIWHQFVFFIFENRKLEF